MKNTFLILALIFCIDTVTHAQYRINKTEYDYRTYQFQPGDPYNPVVAGVASFLIPGIGQMVSGEVGRGAIFLGGNVGCITLFAVGWDKLWNGDGSSVLLLISLAGLVAIHIWAPADAVRVAKVNNLALRGVRKPLSSLSLSPYLGYNQADRIPVGLTLRIKF